MRSYRQLALLLIVLVLLGGCWSRRELESLAYILIMGIEKGEDGGVKLTAQLGLPSQDPAEAENNQVVTVLVAEGRNITEAMDSLFLQTSKRPNLNHLRLIIFSEELAREGLWPVMDYLRRDIRIRTNTKLAVTPDNLEELLGIESPLSSQPALAIIDQFNFNAERSRTVRAEIKDMISWLLEPDLQPVLPVLGASEDKFVLGETAIFSGHQMVAVADREQTLGLLLWKNQVRDGVFTVPLDEDNLVSFRINRSRTRVRVGWEQGRMTVRADVSAIVQMNEVFGLGGEDLEGRAAHFLTNRLDDTLALARREGVDFLNLSARLRRHNPRLWSQVKDDWATVLREAEVDIRTNVVIRRQGQIP